MVITLIVRWITFQNTLKNMHAAILCTRPFGQNYSRLTPHFGVSQRYTVKNAIIYQIFNSTN